MAPVIRIARVVSAMCMIGVSESYSAPKAVNHNCAGGGGHCMSGEREVPLVDKSGTNAATPVPSINYLTLGMIVGLFAAFVSTSAPAFAGDGAAGAKVFDANCVGCHKGGGNVLSKEKTLTKEALQANSKYEIPAITEQVSAGKPPMPAFGQRISAADCENVATYVREQADKGWS